MVNLIFSRIKIENDVVELLNKAGELIGEEKNNFQKTLFLKLKENISKYEAHPAELYNVDLLLHIAVNYAAIMSLQFSPKDFFTAERNFSFAASIDEINELALLHKLLSIASNVVNKNAFENDIKPYALLTFFINEVGCYFYNEDEIEDDEEKIVFNIKYLDHYKKEEILIENAVLMKRDGNFLILKTDDSSDLFIVKNNKLVLLHQPIKDQYMELISPNHFFTQVNMPCGFNIISIEIV